MKCSFCYSRSLSPFFALKSEHINNQYSSKRQRTKPNACGGTVCVKCKAKTHEKSYNCRIRELCVSFFMFDALLSLFLSLPLFFCFVQLISITSMSFIRAAGIISFIELCQRVLIFSLLFANRLDLCITNDNDPMPSIQLAQLAKFMKLPV